MKHIFFALAVFITVSISTSYAQRYGNRFMIAPNYNFNDYSIDRIGQQIYADLYAGTIFKIDLRTMAVETTRFHGMAPIFSSKRHLMLYGDSLYNIDDGSRYAITLKNPTINTGAGLADSFSPNDSNLIYLIPGSPHALNLILSLKDSSLTPIDTSVRAYNQAGPPQWSSDTSFVYAATESCMVEYFIYSRRIDTLVTLHNYDQISSFAYNTKKNILAYSWYPGYVGANTRPLIYFHYRDSSSDYLAFSPLRDDSACWHTALANQLAWLSWSPKNDKLGFIAVSSINDIAEIYSYSLDSNRIYKVTPCNDPGAKYFLQWANEDTLIYLGIDDLHLYGTDVSLIDAIHERKDVPVPRNFSIAAYPNPFNPSTKIMVKLPKRDNGILSIYDIQGKLIKEYTIHNNGGTDYSVIWNAQNNHNERVASGFYLAVLKIDDPVNLIEDPALGGNRKVTKLIYLK
jgi:hypothetical protein